MKTAVVAIGGNAVLRAGEEATLENQMANLRRTSAHLARMIRNGYDMVLTHGNGPQVGNILLQNEICREDVPAMPLDICVGESQGQLGYMIQQVLTEALRNEGLNKVVTCVLTRVVVDPDDPAFGNPTKPIGPYYTEEEAVELRETRGWTLVEDIKRGGYRRVVPSPEPVSIVERSAIRRLVFGGESQAEVVIAAGGGGIPVVMRNGRYEGVEAVIDKDLAACVLACDIHEKLLILLTDVDRVYLNYGTDHAEPLERITTEELERYENEGHFPPGSMGPKVKAATRFLRHGGERVIITSPDLLEAALDGKAGTHITC
jgi:carbamate kinase